MKNAIYSLLLSSVVIPALLVVAPPQASEPERNQSDWPVVPSVQVAEVADPFDGVELVAAANPTIDEQAKSLEKLAEEIRSIAAKVQSDADRAKQAADEAEKNSEGMKSYIPPVSDVQPLTEARVIELIDQRIKELNIECKCVTTGKTEVRKVSTVIDGRGVAAFNVPPGAVLTGYQDVNTGKWVTVNRSQMKTIATSTDGKPVVGYSTQTTEYREIASPLSQPVRAAIRFGASPIKGTCRMVNGVKVCN